jgi:hypothetical protein
MIPIDIFFVGLWPLDDADVNAARNSQVRRYHSAFPVPDGDLCCVAAG